MSSFRQSTVNTFLTVFVSLVGLMSCSSIHPLYRNKNYEDLRLELGGIEKNMIQTSAALKPNINLQTSFASCIVSIVIDTEDDFLKEHLSKHLDFLLSNNGNYAFSETTKEILIKKKTYQLAIKIESFVQMFSNIYIEDIEDSLGRSSIKNIVAKAQYILKPFKGDIVSRHHFSSLVTFQQTQQEYANLQAEKNARERVSIDLAEQIFLLFSLDLLHILDKNSEGDRYTKR